MGATSLSKCLPAGHCAMVKISTIRICGRKAIARTVVRRASGHIDNRGARREGHGGAGLDHLARFPDLQENRQCGGADRRRKDVGELHRDVVGAYELRDAERQSGGQGCGPDLADAAAAIDDPHQNSGIMTAMTGVWRPTIAPSRLKGSPVTADSVVSGTARAPKATGAVSAASAHTAAFRGSMRSATSITATIAIGVPALASASSSAPKQNAIRTACTRKSLDGMPKVRRSTSNYPDSTIMFWIQIALMTIRMTDSTLNAAP
jgi:hypothetical protein